MFWASYVYFVFCPWQFRAYEAPETGPERATKDTLRQVVSDYGLLGLQDYQLVEHELITILRAGGNQRSTFNYVKVIEQIINPTDEFH